MSTPVRLAVNGLGRIGRALVRIARAREELEIAAINDLSPVEQLAPLLARDSLYGPFPGEVRAEGGSLVIDDRKIPFYRVAEPGAIPWERSGEGELVVVEATGAFVRRDLAAAHLRGAVRKVVISANGEGVDLTVCVGVNESSYDPSCHHVVSNASCTTNCVAVTARVLLERFGWRRGLLNTVHCYNNDQHLVDSAHRDRRRARAAAINMIPTTTGAVEAIGRVIPALEGRVTGLAVRVPTPDVSLVDLVVELEAEPTVEEVRQAFREAAAGPMRGILGVTEEELVSSDFVGDTRSAVVDLPLVQTVERRLFRVVAWYDNEWGFASRLADLAQLVGRSR